FKSNAHTEQKKIIADLKKCQKYSNAESRIEYPIELGDNGKICNEIKNSLTFTQIICIPKEFNNLLKNILTATFEISFLSMTMDFPSIDYFLNAFNSESDLNISNVKNYKYNELEIGRAHV